MRAILLIFLFYISTMSWGQPVGYYDNANGSGYDLKTQLHFIIDDINDFNGQSFHDVTVTYSQLWTLYQTSDVRPDGKVWEVYSTCDFEFGTDQDNGFSVSGECERYNREHTFAQSWWGGNTSHPMRADAFHVLPSDKKVNEERGSLAFGEVSSASYTSLNGSKRGTSSISGPIGEVFEPADEYKGDIARGLFYVAVRYQDEISAWETENPNGDSMLDGSSDQVFEQWALNMLYNWHINDPVSTKEINRNEVVYAHQGNRNPFIDHPEFVQLIWQQALNLPPVQLKESISMWPNPVTNGRFTVTSDVPVAIQIFDVLGKSVFKDNRRNSSWSMDLSALRNGIYLLHCKSDSGNVVKKLIIQ